MRKNMLLAAAFVTLASVAAAQTAGVHRGLLIGGSIYTTVTVPQTWMLQLDAAGSPTLVTTGNPVGFNVDGNMIGLTMDAGNNHVVLPGVLRSPVLQLGLFQYDLNTHAIVKTLFAGPPSTSTIGNYSNLTINADGNPVTVDNATAPQALLEFDRFTNGWRRYPLPASTATAGGISGVVWDEFNGGYYHAAWGDPAPAPGSALYQTAYDGTGTRVVASTSGQVSRYGGDLVDNGDFVLSTCCTQLYYLVKAGASTYTPGPAGANTSAYDVTHEKYAAPGRGIWITNYHNMSRTIQYIDLKTGAVTTVFNTSPSLWIHYAFETIPLFDRDLSSLRMGKGTWDLILNPANQAFSGKPYVVAASLAPPRPPVVLPDGREIFIGLDALTVLTTSGPIPPFFTGNVGYLDAQGTATARIDFSSIGTASNGSVLHFCGVVLDPAAPGGIAWVCDPHAFVINVLP